MPKSAVNPLRGRINNILAIWNNDHQDDNGLEKIVRLFLSSSQLLFPGIYIKHLAEKKVPDIRTWQWMDTFWAR